MCTQYVCDRCGAILNSLMCTSNYCSKIPFRTPSGRCYSCSRSPEEIEKHNRDIANGYTSLWGCVVSVVCWVFCCNKEKED